MAYRGQGQKVQKVMVQPIVSYAGCQDREVGARERGGKAGSGLGGAVCAFHIPTSSSDTCKMYRSRIQVWLYEQVNMRIEGCIIGFDEYMNLVLDDAEEIHSKTKSRKQTRTHEMTPPPGFGFAWSGNWAELITKIRM
ncbi:hypothetical protein QTO34_011600 [Cnephaeus nilssonii]|uniref:Small nuclear ribonucleoprotein E n=1 Tax=Cnephaeus nilssonii TaxID=3371016 RepID=A0AA40LF15_CNENI|nr:hypothetical protein QTO34_011600 [Eptesicus nilssonii]